MICLVSAYIFLWHIFFIPCSMTKFKCLVIDPIHSSLFELLDKTPITLDYRPDILPEEVMEIIEDFDGVIVRSKMTMGSDFFRKATNLKFIARAGAGLDLIDEAEAKKHSIHLFNASEGNADAVGEHVIGMLLALMNKIWIGDAEVRKKLWRREENRGYEINGKTVGIVGYGYMGNAVAKRLTGFGCNVVAFDKYKENYGNEWARQVTLEQLKEETEILTLHIPLNSENKGLINYEYLSSFKKNIWLVNASRGEVLITKDLIKCMESGKIFGAALDVLENEKLHSLTTEQEIDFNYLIQSNKVLLTPHIAGWTHESYYKINKVLVEKILDSDILKP